jgi:hypothetical protein
MSWEKSIKRDLKNRYITKELALDRREWKLVIHVSKPWSSVHSLLLPFYQVSSRPFSLFDLVFYWLFSFLIWFFIVIFFHTPSFSLLFYPCFLAHVISSLAYHNLLGNKDLVVIALNSIFFHWLSIWWNYNLFPPMLLSCAFKTMKSCISSFI